MKILFYYDPIAHKYDSLWRQAHFNLDMPMIRELGKEVTAGRTETRIAIGERYLPIAEKHGVDLDLITLLDPKIMLSSIGRIHDDINRMFFEKRLDQTELMKLAEYVRVKLQGFVPDVIITWTPAPFFELIYPEALILHKEMSVFQRNPFPSTFFLDPKGCYMDSLLSENLTHPGKVPRVTNEHLEIFNRLRTDFCAQITAKTPFKDVVGVFRKSFEKLILLPLQYNGSFSFDGMCAFRSQMELAENVLKSVPSSYGVVITSHTYGEFSTQEKKYLQDNYSNAIFVAETRHYHNSSDLLLPLVDAVVTVTSTLGLKALLWKKKLISVGQPYLGMLDDSNDLLKIQSVMELDYDSAKDMPLAWICLYFSYPLDKCATPGWAENLLSRMLENHKEGHVESSFDQFHGDFEEMVEGMTKGLLNSRFPFRNERTSLEDCIEGFNPRQLVGLRTCLEQSDLIRNGASTDQEVLWKNIRSVFDTLDPISLGLSAGGNGTGNEKSKFRITLLYASGRWNASGLYLQDLCRELVRKGAECMIIAEGDIPEGGVEDGVQWRRFAFDGYLLDPKLKREVIDFAPDVLYVINVRFKPMRAAIELHLTTGAKISVQSEDDDTLIYKKFHPKSDSRMLEILDKPRIFNKDIREFMSLMDWEYTLSVYEGKRRYRDVEPLLRVVCYKLSVLNTAIWYPMQDRLVNAFGRPGLIVPPVIDTSSYDGEPIDRQTRERVLTRWGIDPSHLVVFLGGSIYGFSPEFETFLESLKIVSKTVEVTLAIAGKSMVDIDEVKDRILGNTVPLISLESPPDKEYLEMMQAADVIAAPGYPDTFNKYRLSSRLVKAMALSKPIFTYECGFGESLEHGISAVLTIGEDPVEWAEKLLILADPGTRLMIGKAARKFALAHFEAKDVAERLLQAFTGSPDGISQPSIGSAPPHEKLRLFLEEFEQSRGLLLDGLGVASVDGEAPVAKT